jgi:peptide/nickel transport system permease protein
MAAFLLRRAGASLVVVFVISLLVFAGVRAIPGDPAVVMAGDSADPAVIKAIRHEYLLDKPLPEQYVKWAWLVLQGNLGRDERRLPIGATIVSHIPLTLELACLGVLISVVVGIPAGMLAAARGGKPTDRVLTTLALVSLSVPHFWLALLVIIWFAVDLHWLPATGYVTLHHPIANLRHMLLPCLVLGSGLAAVQMRYMRSAMIDSLGADYVRTARAKGLGEWAVIGRHALRNSLITNVTVIGLEFGALVSGAAIIEVIFGIPGFGALALQAIDGRDYPLVEGIVLVTAVSWVLVSLAVDIAYSFLDPRIRIGGAPA